MFNNSKEYYNLEEVMEGLTNIIGEPVTPSMIHDYIRINKLVPYVLYSGIVFGASHRTVYHDKPIEVGLMNARATCTAIFKASIKNIELLPYNIAPRLGDSSPLFDLEEIISDRNKAMKLLEGMQPLGYRLYFLDGHINKESKEEPNCVLKFKSHDLIKFSSDINENIELNNLIKQVETQKKNIKNLNSKIKSYEIILNNIDSDKTNEKLHPIEKKNLISSLIKAFGTATAAYLWEMDVNKKIRKGRMIEQVKSILYKVESPMLAHSINPELLDSIKVSGETSIDKWLKDVAPAYAKKGGRSKKNDDEVIILHLKK